jgi:hypothetical protein
MDEAKAQEAKGESPGEAEPEKDQDKDQEKTKDEPKEAKSKGQGGQGGDGPKGSRGKGQTPMGDPDEKDDPAGKAPKDRREAMEKQEQIADDARALEERLKRLEAVSDLAKERMTKAAEAAEKAASALARGSTKEGTDAARAGALMLHEVARQVKGEISREVTDELAMARDLADELARREDEFGQGSDKEPAPGSDGTQGKDDDGRQPGKGEKGDKGSPGAGRGGVNGWGDWNALTDAERLERMEEAARTLREWLTGASKNAEGNAAERVRELMEQGPVAEVVERSERIGTLYQGGQKPEARREARELARTLEVLARQLDILHRGIVAPELARLVEFDRRVAELTAKLKTLTSQAQVDDWHRLATALVRDMEKAGLADAAAALNRLIEARVVRGRGPVEWAGGPDGYLIPPETYVTSLSNVVARLQDRVQDLILKDLASDRDEATPPEFRELVERYYEVLSSETAARAK